MLRIKHGVCSHTPLLPQIVYNGSPSDAGVSAPRGTKARIVTLEEVQAAGRWGQLVF